MLIDEVEVELSGGHGGRGAVAFQKVRLMQGPTGGDGGRGASIAFEGVSDLGMLVQFAHRKTIQAPNGRDGRGQFLDGHAGEDIILRVPVGSVITNLDSGDEMEMTKIGQRIPAVSGGEGGKGNFKYRSSVDISPRRFQPGLPGQTAWFRVELKLIADVGLVGLPNAGKSSLLNELTGAKSRIGNYAFTTLEPHLGTYYGIIIADIPGLIEGASDGKGLGHKFLKHVERTKTLFHLISSESDDVLRDYKTIRTELETYSPTLSEKKEHVFLTKSDAIEENVLKQHIKTLNKAGIDAIAFSILDEKTLEPVRNILNDVRNSKVQESAKMS